MVKYVLQGLGLFIFMLSGKTMMAENALFLLTLATQIFYLLCSERLESISRQ